MIETNSSSRRPSLHASLVRAHARAAVVTLAQAGNQFDQPPIINGTQLLLETFHAVAEQV